MVIDENIYLRNVDTIISKAVNWMYYNTLKLSLKSQKNSLYKCSVGILSLLLLLCLLVY